jgi:hypothetical protein
VTSSQSRLSIEPTDGAASSENWLSEANEEAASEASSADSEAMTMLAEFRSKRNKGNRWLTLVAIDSVHDVGIVLTKDFLYPYSRCKRSLSCEERLLLDASDHRGRVHGNVR